MRGSRVQLLVAAPSAGHAVSNDNVSACIYRDNAPCIVDMRRGGGQNRASLLGGVPERSKGSDCKSDGTAFEGSNPSPSTRSAADNADVVDFCVLNALRGEPGFGSGERRWCVGCAVR